MRLSEPRSCFERFGEEKDPLPVHAVQPRRLSPSTRSLITIPNELSVPASELILETGILRFCDITLTSAKFLL